MRWFRIRNNAAYVWRLAEWQGTLSVTIAFLLQKDAVVASPIGGFPMLWTIAVILLILWVLGFAVHIGGGLIHLLLVAAVVVVIFNLVSGRRAV